MLKICYGVNITYIQSPNKDHLKYLNFKFQHAYSFSCLWKKDGKLFAKNIVTFRHTKFEVTITKISIENIITHQWLALIPIWNIYICLQKGQVFSGGRFQVQVKAKVKTIEVIFGWITLGRHNMFLFISSKNSVEFVY